VPLLPPVGKVPSNTAETQTQEKPSANACRLSCWLEVDLNNEYLKRSSALLNEKIYLNVITVTSFILKLFKAIAHRSEPTKHARFQLNSKKVMLLNYAWRQCIAALETMRGYLDDINLK